MQGMLLWLGHSEVSSSRCHSLPSIDGAPLVAIQATLAMRPVKPSIQPATYVQPATSALYNSPAALVPAPAQNTLFIEDAIAVRREFSSILPEVP